MKKTLLNAVIAMLIAVSTLAVAPTVGAASMPVRKTSTSRSTRPASLKSVFQSAIGKYPMDVNLLRKPAMKSRLVKLLGQSRYNTMAKYFEVQVPIEFSNWNYYTWGAQAHMCGYNEFQISYNPEQDALAVKYIWEGNEKVYKEKPSVKAYWDYQ